MINGQIDFQKCISCDSDMMDLTNGGSSLTKMDPRNNRRNLVEVLTDHGIDSLRIHNAKYDVELLMECFWIYVDRHFISNMTEFKRLWLDKTENIMISVRNDVNKSYHKINKRQSDDVIVFNGF